MRDKPGKGAIQTGKKELFLFCNKTKDIAERAYAVQSNSCPKTYELGFHMVTSGEELSCMSYLTISQHVKTM
jgi:hypothetical protein